MSDTAQVNNSAPYVNRQGDLIVLNTQEFTLPEARRLVNELRDAIKNCNGAIPKFENESSLFASADDGSVFTAYLNDEEEFNAARAAFNIERAGSILPVIGAIMHFHADQESLNIIVADSVMEAHAKSYLTFTGQFATLLSKVSEEFLRVRVLYDKERKQCGIFCRKSDFDLSVTFRGQLIAALKREGRVSVKLENVPETYILYPSTLIHFLRKRLPDCEVSAKKTRTTFEIVAEKIV